MATAAIKRQRKRRRVDTDGDPEFQVAPMVDVLLVLMLFFMAITSTEVLQKHQNVQLADATHAKPNDQNKDQKNQIIINVEWTEGTSSARFFLDPVSSDTADGLASILAQKHAENPAAYVVIRADRDVEYSSISDMMTVCGNAGIGSVAFAVLVNNHKPAASAPATTASQ
jgi:biopolymer transport protein ExbD